MAGDTFNVPTRFESKAAPPTDRTWAGVCQEVYDGDTITVALDLGFGHWFRTQLRLAGIDAPEVRGAEKLQAEVSRDYLRRRLLGKWCIVHCGRHEFEKYGRVLGRVFISEGGKWIDLSVEMVTAGMARPYLEDRDETLLPVPANPEPA